MKKDKLNTYILLDRTGSMQNRWTEALSSINVYVEELNKNKTPALVTVAVFDSHNGLQFDVVRNAVDSKKFEKLTDKDATPRGGTPLFDALGRIISLAESDKKAVLVVMTDGEENSSTETTRDGAKAALERFKSKGNQVVFLGADFNAFGQSASVGVNLNQTLNATAGNYANAMRSVATQATAYATMDCAMSFSDEDRKKAGGK